MATIYAAYAIETKASETLKRIARERATELVDDAVKARGGCDALVTWTEAPHNKKTTKVSGVVTYTDLRQ